MVTTRRSTNVSNSVFEQRTTGGVDVLERPTPVAAGEVAAKVDFSEAQNQEAKERRKNLDRLLNYDRFSESMVASAPAETIVKERPVVKENVKLVNKSTALSEEDIRPTSTTMQFGEDIDGIREEMKAKPVEESVSYKLNGKGKLAIVLYSLVVTVILALIVMNTGMLSRLSNTNQAKVEELNAAVAQYNTIMSEVDSISTSEHIANVAESQFGMVKGN